ncbi:hypothetical protein EDS67_10255 [candidate division KSB1 bacterium]|nr:MAG: hypothetical protein EDS67_10255 [candidate division KSB1 bacterium]MCE7941761.1 hypothetical protein [Chlorobi bacterium CHB1]
MTRLRFFRKFHQARTAQSQALLFLAKPVRTPIVYSRFCAVQDAEEQTGRVRASAGIAAKNSLMKKIFKIC